MTPTPEQIDAWALEAGVEPSDLARWVGDDEAYVFYLSELQRFAALACAWQAEQDAKRVRELEASLYELRDLLKRRPALSSNMAAEYLLWSNSVYQLSAMNAVDAASVKGKTCQN